MITSKKRCPICGKIYEVQSLVMSPFGVEMCSEVYCSIIKNTNRCPRCGYVKYCEKTGEIKEEIPKSFPGRVRV